MFVAAAARGTGSAMQQSRCQPQRPLASASPSQLLRARRVASSARGRCCSSTGGAHSRCASTSSWAAGRARRPQRHIAAAAAEQATEAAPAAAASASQGQQPAASEPPAASTSEQQLRGSAVVRAFYDAYNRRDLDAISRLIADDISYHDLVYEEPHEGRAGVLAWLDKVRRYAPDDLLFVIEDITDGDAHKVGVMWHVECGDGVVFPFSRGCSFITLDPSGTRIATVRDIVEPAFKPGDSTLQLLGTLTPLIRSLGPGGADPARLKQLPVASAAVWALYVGYMSLIMFSTAVPGAPAWATPPQVFEELLQESINLWWINDALTAAGIALVPHTPSPPVSEALFNFVLAWAAMFAPVLFTDGPSQKIKHKGWWFVAIMMITNVFFIPFMALRAAPEPLEPAAAAVAAAGGPPQSRRVPVPGSQALPGWARALGVAGGALGVFCVAWALVGRPEYGGLAERWDYLVATASSNRVFFAFWLDLLLFWVWQAAFLADAPLAYSAVPYFGLAAWLAVGGTQQADKQDDA